MRKRIPGIRGIAGVSSGQAVSIGYAWRPARIFAQARFNGNALIPADTADNPAVQQVIADIIACLGPETDQSGKPAVSRDQADRFFADARAYARWLQEAQTDSRRILPFGGEATAAAADLFRAVKGKGEDYFTRCRLVKYGLRVLNALNRQETEHIAIAAKNLTPAIAAVTGFLNLSWRQMPIAVGGLMLLISGPSMIIARLKLRQRTIGPILDDNG